MHAFSSESCTCYLGIWLEATLRIQSIRALARKYYVWKLTSLKSMEHFGYSQRISLSLWFHNFVFSLFTPGSSEVATHFPPCATQSASVAVQHSVPSCGKQESSGIVRLFG